MYRIIDDGSSEIVEKKSRFLGFAISVDSADEAVDKITEIRKKHYDARHVCYAYVIDGLVKSSDDGEPQGSAGRPITDVLVHLGLDHCLVAVVRYFGGILLGVGGLIRAYTSAAQEALDDASLMELHSGFPLTVTLDYNEYGKADYFFNENRIPRTGTEYGTGVTLHLMVPSELKPLVDKHLAEITAGKASPDWGDEQEYGIVDGEVISI
jgi:uncharacterized YigZ family protein